MTDEGSAEKWIGGYDDLDAYIDDCRDQDALWILARSMSEDFRESGYGVIDAGEVFEALLRRRRQVGQEKVG